MLGVEQMEIFTRGYFWIGSLHHWQLRNILFQLPQEHWCVARNVELWTKNELTILTVLYHWIICSGFGNTVSI